MYEETKAQGSKIISAGWKLVSGSTGFPTQAIQPQRPPP